MQPPQAAPKDLHALVRQMLTMTAAEREAVLAHLSLAEKIGMMMEVRLLREENAITAGLQTETEVTPGA